MAPFGSARHGKQEARKEISLIGMARSLRHAGHDCCVNHLLESFIDGLNSRRPALFNIYAVCPPEHGVGDEYQRCTERLAVEGRALSAVASSDAGVPFQRMCQPRRQSIDRD